jgi:serine/threonine protein kinase
MGLIHCYGVTQDPITQNYALVLPFMENGSLRSYLNQNFNSLTWIQKFYIIRSISFGLHNIHRNNLTHKDLHLWNVLHSEDININTLGARISDFGFCKPVYEISSNSNSKNVYGVMPYMAPEILRGKKYTQKSDVYSFGIIMNEIISIVPPFNNEPHDYHLALDICRGKRPKIREETPEFLKELIQKCWDANPENRPTSSEVRVELGNCINKKYEPEKLEELSYEFTESTDTKLFETHPQAIYTSRLLNFSNLPEPVNCPNQEEFVSSRNGKFITLFILYYKLLIINFIDTLRFECLDCAINLLGKKNTLL